MATIIDGEEEISVRDRSEIKGQKGQNIQNSIRIAVCSELRRRIIIALREGKRALRVEGFTWGKFYNCDTCIEGA